MSTTLRTDLGCRPRLDGARRFALGHAKLLSRASAQQRAGGLAQQRAATTQTPRRPIGAGGVGGRLVWPGQGLLPRSWPTPELGIPNAAAQTQIISKARIRLDQRKSVRPFKGIICVDISEFDPVSRSYHANTPQNGAVPRQRHCWPTCCILLLAA